MQLSPLATPFGYKVLRKSLYHHIFCHNYSSSLGAASSGLPPCSGFEAEPAIFAGTLGSSNPATGSFPNASLASFGHLISSVN